MKHQTLGQWDNRPIDPSTQHIEDCRISDVMIINNNLFMWKCKFVEVYCKYLWLWWDTTRKCSDFNLLVVVRPAGQLCLYDRLPQMDVIWTLKLYYGGEWETTYLTANILLFQKEFNSCCTVLHQEMASKQLLIL